MQIPTLVTGDDVSIPVTLKINGAVFDMGGALDCSVMIVRPDHKVAFTGEIAQSNLTPGADWPNSLVVVVIPGAQTEPIDYQGEALLEIQVTDNSSNKRTWFVSIQLIKGHVS